MSPHLVLVVDDDRTVRILVREALEQAGFAVEEAADGVQAMAAFERLRPDIVLLDVGLPEVDGFAVCAALRRRPADELRPVLMMTALDDLESIRRAYEVGATDFITKPVNWAILSHRVRYMLRASQTLEALQLSEARLSRAQTIAKLGHWELDLQEKVLVWSDEVYRIHGLAPGSAAPSLELRAHAVHPEDRALARGALEAALAAQQPYSVEYRLRLPDGRVRLVHEQAELTGPAASGRPRLLGTLQDITERKQAEAALRESEERFKKAFHAAPDAIAIRRLDGRYIDAKEEFLGLAGCRAEELVGRATIEPHRGVAPEEYARAVRLLQSERRVRDLEVEFRTTSGQLRDMLLSLELIELAGEPAVLSIARDITERKRLEAQLSRAQKMEAIGNLAGGIAHDFNNLLAVILGYAELALRDAPPDGKVARRLGEILAAGNHAKEVVRQILTFSRRTKSERKPVQLQLLVKETLTLLRASLPSTIEIHHALSADTGSVLADPTQLHQVLMNLCCNAEHAMREAGGVLHVGLDRTEVDAAFADGHPGLRPGPYVRLSVRDSGHGMAPDVVERIFEPFFTTKEVGEGTGMGLAMTHGIVASHGGAITVTTAPGRGATFEVYLPELTVTTRDERGPAGAARGGSERILFVDDEVVILEIWREMLDGLGYRCVGHTSSHQALSAFRAAPESFDLVITDQTMPGMTGDALIRELRRIRPDVPVILCTGYSHKVSPEKARSLGVDAYLMKPLRAGDLDHAIRSVMERHHAASAGVNP
jgi:PAS domain S-box-containing protein